MNAFDRKLTQFNAKRETHKRPKVLPNLTEVEKDSFRELRSTVQEYLGRSDYTWVKPTLWKTFLVVKELVRLLRKFDCVFSEKNSYTKTE